MDVDLPKKQLDEQAEVTPPPIPTENGDSDEIEQVEIKDWKERTGLDEEQLCAVLETLIFMSERPLRIQKMKEMIDELIPLRVIHESLQRLQDEYESKHHGIRLQEVAEGYQFRTKATYAKYVQDLFKVSSLVLSPTALEVLAIVAYRQPVSRLEIEKIRGVDSSHILRALIDKRLVKLEGRSDEMGRPALYVTTPEFLEVFNLNSIEDLPAEYELEAMATKNQVGEIKDIREFIANKDSSQFKFDEIEELDQLQKEIKLVKVSTPFTKTLTDEDKKKGDKADKLFKRSAFDLLEEFISMDSIQAQNILAAQSELLTSVANPKVISDLLAGPYNVPEVEDDELTLLDDKECYQDIENSEEDFDDLFADSSAEGQENLTSAIDDAFDKLMNKTPQDKFDELEIGNEDKLNKAQAELAQKTSNLREKGKDLDLDLDFLDVESEKDSSDST